MSVHTITMSPQQISALEKQLQGCEKRKTPPYARYQYRLSDCVITAYESGKVVFQGEGADLYAAPFAQARPKAAAVNCIRNKKTICSAAAPDCLRTSPTNSA